MRIRQMEGLLIVSAESETERAQLAIWATGREGQRVTIAVRGDGSVGLTDANSSPACDNAPINITFDTTPMPLQLVSNLAETPFVLDRRSYASIEGFWQGLKFVDAADRRRLADLSGHTAKAAGPPSRPGDRIVYEGREVCVGTLDHWALMQRACEAKFARHEAARAALLSTGTRPLEHKAAVDSRTIPGIIMADIWMRIRMRIRARLASA